MLHRVGLIFSALLLLMLVMPYNANAQSQAFETKQFTTTDEETFDLPPPKEIDRSFLEEMDHIYRKCETDYYQSGHRDCQCYAMAYLEQRLKYQNVSERVIKTALEGRCFDRKKMEAHYYGVCATKIKLDSVIRDKKDPTKICACYSETVPNMLMTLKNINSKAIHAIQKKAHSECGLY